MNKIFMELLISCLLCIFGCYLIITNTNWLVFFGIFLLLWSNNINIKYSNNPKLINKIFKL